MNAALFVGLVGVALALLSLGLTILFFVLGQRRTRPDSELLGKLYNRIVHGADHVKALAGKVALRGTVSARLIRRDGTTVDLGELKPPQDQVS